MTMAASARQDAAGRIAFRHYLRTRQVLALAETIETKFNPNHDPQNGRFTSRPGGTAQGLRKAALASANGGIGPNHIVKLKPLGPDEVAIVHKLAATPSVMQAMNDAWMQSEKDGKERGFIIYRDGTNYFAGQSVTGTDKELPGLNTKIRYPNPLAGNFAIPVAWYHTHPGNYVGVGEADNFDRSFNRSIRTPRVFMIIRSRNNTFKVGR